MGALEYFSTNQWTWTCANLDKLHSDLAAADKQSLEAFDFNIEPMDWRLFMDDYVLGTRHFVIKNNPDTLESSQRKLRFFYLLHLAAQLIPAFLAYCLFYGLLSHCSFMRIHNNI